MAIRGLQNQLALLHATRLQPGESDAPDDGSGIGYHISVAPAQLSDQKGNPVAATYTAMVTATWHDHGEVQERSVSELIYQP
ncbi:MAG: hypothetical protein WDO13_12600 [Verrucomicrobiota bacterium]